MKNTKKIITLLCVGTMVFSSVTVNAAAESQTAKQHADYMMSIGKDEAPNWFLGAYYQNQYPDLKVSFENNEKALYHHSLQYGFAESRTVSPVLDVAKYRAAYPDLEQAFGDNWELYVRHYFECGITEGRDNFTEFDAKTYLSLYPDLEFAFGDDLVSATEHYLEHGFLEGRIFIKPEPKVQPVPNDEPVNIPGSDEDTLPDDTITDDDSFSDGSMGSGSAESDPSGDSSMGSGSAESDPSGDSSMGSGSAESDPSGDSSMGSDSTESDPSGDSSMEDSSTDDDSSGNNTTENEPAFREERFDFDDGSYILSTYVYGILTTEKIYDSDGVIQYIDEYENERLTKIYDYIAGEYIGYTYIEYNANGTETKRTTFDTSDMETVRFEYTYDTNGNMTELREYHAGEYVIRTVYEDHKETTYTADGILLHEIILYEDGGIRFITHYNDNNEMTSCTEYDQHGCVTKEILYTDGEETYYSENTYDTNGLRIEEKVYNNGVYSYLLTYEYDENGRQTKRLEYVINNDSEILNEILEYTYASDGGWTLTTKRGDGSLFRVEVYDNENNQISYTEYDENGNPIV